jgi:hypothetical protein
MQRPMLNLAQKISQTGGQCTPAANGTRSWSLKSQMFAFSSTHPSPLILCLSLQVRLCPS